MSGGEDVDLTAAGVLELAWGMGLLTWQDSPKAGWYDTDGEMVEESDNPGALPRRGRGPLRYP